MNHFPVDTRIQYKSQHRDQMSFPQTLPTNFNTSYGEVAFSHTPNYDRNMFSAGVVEQPPRNMNNDRLMENSQLFNNFGRETEYRTFSNTLNSVDIPKKNTRERRDEKIMTNEMRNIDRMMVGGRDYYAEMGDRLNGFGLMARDTRFESSKKGEDGKIEMRANRYLGMPGNNL